MSDFLFYGLLAGGTLLVWGVASLAADALQSHIDGWGDSHVGGLALSRPRLVQRTLVTRLRRLVGAFRIRSRRAVGQKFQQAHYAKHHPRISAWKGIVER